MKRKINNSNMLRRCLALFIVIMLATVVLCTTVSAASIQTVPYDNYTIWNGYDKKVTTSQRPVYEFNKAVTGGDLGLSAFTEANDICTDVNGNAYIMDTNNGRVIVLNPDLTLKTVLSDFTYNGEVLDIKGALGLFVNTDGKIDIADTKNLVIDVKGMEYISSAGLRVLLGAQKKMQKIGSMKVINVCVGVMEVFEMTGFSDILTIE